MPFIIPAIAGYLLAAAFSADVSVNMMNTDWTSAWTYVWWGVLAVAVRGAQFELARHVTMAKIDRMFR